MRSMFLPSVRSSRAAAVLGVAVASLGAALALASAAMAAVSEEASWLLLMLPALGLLKLGTTIYRARYDLAAGPRRLRPARISRSFVQDFAHHNKAWDNVARWEARYDHGERSERSIGKPQRKLESWALRLKR